MNSKIISIAAALLMGFTFSSFAGTPKGETKTEATEAKTESPTESKITAGAGLYWYRVTYNASYTGGAVLSTTDYYDNGTAEEVDSPCPSGSAADCLRGFTNPISSFPHTGSGTEQIKRN